MKVLTHWNKPNITNNLITQFYKIMNYLKAIFTTISVILYFWIKLFKSDSKTEIILNRFMAMPENIYIAIKKNYFDLKKFM